MTNASNKLFTYPGRQTRQRAFRVAIAYTGLALFLFWIVSRAALQLNFPHWVVIVAAAILLMGLPLVLWRTRGTRRRLGELADVQITIPADPAREPTAAIDKDDRRSIAVLPFVDMSREKDQEYFCDGMAEELIDALTKIPDLRVVSRSTSFAFKGKGLDSHEVGEQLHVETLLEGSVRKSGDRLRITAQLIKVADGSQIWSERFDREMEDIFDIQDEISLAIVDQLKIELLGTGKEGLVRRSTEDVEAYNLYWQGRYHWNKRCEEDLIQSIDYFELAIEADPDFALAYAGLADTYNILGYYSMAAPRETFPKAKEVTAKALELDDTLAEAYATQALTNLYFDWDWEEAEKNFKRALELNPSYATAHHWYAEYLAIMGRIQEAATEAWQAYESDPQSRIINVLLGWTYYYSYDYGKAISHYRKTLKLDPDFIAARLYLGLALAQESLTDQAVEELQKAMKMCGSSELITTLIGHAYAMAGQRERAEEIVSELLKDSPGRYVPAYYIAAIYADLFERDQAMMWLEKAYEARESWMPFLAVDPIWYSLRSDPAFVALLKKMKLA
ncbi:MAG: tetratricopeptide repeat protein [Fidelibacterota bacterium]|nr:MAG: tetratricopeptide repeat protein [Candidatus Neomarinimicrobiota bacterium]